MLSKISTRISSFGHSPCSQFLIPSTTGHQQNFDVQFLYTVNH